MGLSALHLCETQNLFMNIRALCWEEHCKLASQSVQPCESIFKHKILSSLRHETLILGKLKKSKLGSTIPDTLHLC